MENIITNNTQRIHNCFLFNQQKNKSRIKSKIINIISFFNINHKKN